MEGDEVSDRVDLRVRLDALDAELAEAFGRNERVVGDDAHAEPGRPSRNLLPDSAEAENTERLARQLHAAVGLAFPAALLERGVSLRNVPRQGDEQADGVLGRRHDGGLRRIRYDDPASRGGGNVDVVDADPRTADDLELVGARDQLGCDLRRRAHDDRVVFADRLGQV